MNILILGNGFDLAHGLETKYSDFLDNIQRFKNVNNDMQINKSGELYNQAKPIYKYLNRVIFDNNSYGRELEKLIDNNFWINYFFTVREERMNRGENWVDFEKEISKIVSSLDNDMFDEKGNRLELSDNILNLSNEYLKHEYFKYTSDAQLINASKNGKIEYISFKKIRDRLQYDLNRIIRALEIYLADYIENEECKKVSPDIINGQFDAILSFNYTNTYEKIYDLNKKASYDYIHGKVDLMNSIDTNNMVLGIDEYLNDDRRNSDVEFIGFKKYYQRIHKETGCKYKQWVEQIGLDSKKKSWLVDNKDYSKDFTHNLYIYGHSLDITDGDILRELILNDNVYTTIYYQNKEIMGNQIANLVKVIGQDELIKRTGGSSKTISFKLQQSMTNIEDYNI